LRKIKSNKQKNIDKQQQQQQQCVVNKERKANEVRFFFFRRRRKMEEMKEIAFGAVAGLCAGYVTKKMGVPVLAGVLTTSFILFRGAIFDGYLLFKQSPLKIDNPSFANHMKRKLRRETVNSEKRLDMFFRENGVVIGSFGGAIILGQLL